jgi:hypothetical protein
MPSKSGKNKTVLLSCAVAAMLLLGGAAYFFLWERGPSDENGYKEQPPVYETPPPEANNTPAISHQPSDDGLRLAPTALGGIQITPLDVNERGVEPWSSFLITSGMTLLTASYLAESLSVPCGEPFTLEERGDNAFLLRFSNVLKNNRIYNFIYHPAGYAPASHAFQTTDIFRISATSPAHNTHDIPRTAGIEITFSQELAGGLEGAFAIEPTVGGRFERRDSTYIFIPDGLAFNTLYTITVQRGLVSVTGETLDEDYIFSFRIRWGEGGAEAFSIHGSAYETFLPWNTPTIPIALNIAPDFAGRDFTVRLYDLHDPADFINFTETGARTLLSAHELTAQDFSPNEWQRVFYIFPEANLSEGYYMAEIRSSDPAIRITARKFIQISALSVYSLSVDGETVFWVHDLRTGQPAEGAEIQVGDVVARTDREGIAIANTRQNSRAPVTISYGDHKPFAYSKPTFGERLLIPADRFLTYMYTDRPAYRPDDTIDVFGVVLPRYGHAHQPTDRLTLRIGNIIEREITLDAYNSFALRIPVTGMFGHADIEVRVNGERLMSSWVNFLDYTNHAFVIEGAFERLAYCVGETALARVSVTTFAGNPVDGVRLRHNDLAFTTNDQGIATVRLPANNPDGNQAHAASWMPHWTSRWVSVAGDAQAAQGIGLPMITVPRNIMLEHEMTDDALTLNAYDVLINNLNEPGRELPLWGYISPDIYRGAATDIDFTINITRHTTVRTVRSEQYDHINRRIVTVYDYGVKSEHYRTIRGRTENGKAVITNLPDFTDPMVRYEITVLYNDSLGRPTQTWIHQAWRPYQQESAMRHFSLSPERVRLGVNETIQVALMEGRQWIGWDWVHGELTPLDEGRMLAVLVRNGIVSATAGVPLGVPVTFTEGCISDALLFGAYFDERLRAIYPVHQPVTLAFDHETRRLDMELSFDRERYRPGDTVTVSVNAAAASQVLISVIDESSLMGWGHNADFLSRLYQSATRSLWAVNHAQFASYTQYNFGDDSSDGWGGGNGDGYGNHGFREIFIDNPVFETVQTDGDGRADLTFTLPHQTTSWRVTAIGLTQDGRAGNKRGQVISALDFYVDLLLTPEYIIGDDIAAAARTHGAGDAQVEYTFAVLQNGEVLFTNTQTAGRRAEFNAGKLAIGEYAMRVTAESEDRRDAVELPFTVARSGMVIENRARSTISPETGTLDPGRYEKRDLPVRVTLMNAAIGPLTRILLSASDANSHRTDHQAAAAFMERFFSGEAGLYSGVARFHDWTGGVPQLAYENADFFYTARFAASFPQFVNRDDIVRYMAQEGTHNTTPAGRAARLLALAAVGEPVLLAVQREAKALGENDYIPWLYLVAALAAAGDDAGALALFTENPVPAPLNLNETTRETAATLRLFINTTLNPQAAFDYINRGEANRFISDVPERVNFVRRAHLLGENVSEVRYTLNGEVHTAVLANFDSVSLLLSKAQFDALTLTPVSGETEYHIHFYGYDHANWDEADDQIHITRTITPHNGLYRVELFVTVPSHQRGAFTIHDRLPGNLRYVPFRQGGHWHPGESFFSARHVQRQLVELTFFRGQNAPQTRSLRYYAMKLFDGDMAAGTTYVSNRRVDGHIWGMTR